MIDFIVPGEPQGKARARTVHTKYGARTFTPEKTELYENWIKTCYLQKWGDKKIRGELAIKITAYFGIPNTPKKPEWIEEDIKPKRLKELMRENRIRPTKKPDFDNISKVIADSLNGIAYKDDAQIVTAFFDKFYSDEPRVEVTITKIGELG